MFLDLCKKRRSIRKFTDEKVLDEDLEYILKCALLSPTAKNLDCKKYVVVRDKDMLKKLSVFKKGTARFLENANVAIVVLTNREIAENTYSQDASITATFIQLAAESLNLGSCWANVLEQRNAEGELGHKVIRNLLNIPEKYNVECIIGIGHKNEVRSAKKELDFKEHVHFEQF